MRANSWGEIMESALQYNQAARRASADANSETNMLEERAYPDDTIGEPFVDHPKMSIRDVDVFYDQDQAINNVSLDIGKNEVVALIGPSGCGKTTFLRALNRMNDIIDSCRIRGELQLDGEDIYGADMDVVELRARVGIVFQKPNPFPKSIYENVAYGPRLHGLAEKRHELARKWMTWWRRACARRGCGKKSRIVWISRARACPVVSSSVFVSPAALP